MKTIFAVLLTASAVFAQPSRREARNTVSLTYEHVAPNCAALGQTDMMQQLSSGCFWDRIQVTARSTNPRILGFLITAAYIDANGKTKTETKAVMPGVSVYMAGVDSNGNFTASFVPVDSTFVSATAIEVLIGGSATTD